MEQFSQAKQTGAHRAFHTHCLCRPALSKGVSNNIEKENRRYIFAERPCMWRKQSCFRSVNISSDLFVLKSQHHPVCVSAHFVGMWVTLPTNKSVCARERESELWYKQIKSWTYAKLLSKTCTHSPWRFRHRQTPVPTLSPTLQVPHVPKYHVQILHALKKCKLYKHHWKGEHEIPYHPSPLRPRERRMEPGYARTGGSLQWLAHLLSGVELISCVLAVVLHSLIFTRAHTHSQPSAHTH